jgi:hypothetical protein
MNVTQQRLDDRHDFTLLNENINATNETQIFVASSNETGSDKN